LEQYNNALTDINNAIKKNENDIYFNFKGDIFFAEEKYKDAINAYDSAIKIDNANAVYYYNRGRMHYFAADNALFLKGGFEKAIADFSRSIELDPSDSYCYMWRGFAYHRTGQFPLAIRDYNEAKRLNPDLSENIDPRLELAKQDKRDFGLFEGSIWQ
jgi:tetratricopeptide (TPR) repeat protein